MSPASNGSSNITYLKRIFHRLDVNEDGRISPEELQLFIKTIDDEVLSFHDVKELVSSADEDGDGSLCLEEFIELMEKKIGNGVDQDKEEEVKEKELREAFKVYATEGSDQGCITAASLKRALSKLGTSKGLAECMEMINSFDVNGDGVLSFDEFRFMLL